MTSAHHPSSLRLFVGAEVPLRAGQLVNLPDMAAKHAQVRRAQPGDRLMLFDGRGVQCLAHIVSMGRQQVAVEIGAAVAGAPELAMRVTLAVVIPANERMDSMVEKATELGAWSLQPLMSTRSVLRLQGERAQRRQAHWQGVAVAAAEQCGRAWVPEVSPVITLQAWLSSLAATSPASAEVRWLLSLDGAAKRPARPADHQSVLALSGPEGGFTADEEAAAKGAGFLPITLGPRVLRADTAPLALMAWLAVELSA